jgi:hypothetical protein
VSGWLWFGLILSNIALKYRDPSSFAIKIQKQSEKKTKKPVRLQKTKFGEDPLLTTMRTVAFSALVSASAALWTSPAAPP